MGPLFSHSVMRKRPGQSPKARNSQQSSSTIAVMYTARMPWLATEKPKELYEYSPILALAWRLSRIIPQVRRAQDEQREREEKK